MLSQEKNSRIATQLLGDIAEGRDPDAIAVKFSEDVVFEIPGNKGALPWIGRKTGRTAVADFIRGVNSMTERVKFDIQDVLANDDRAVIVGELATRIKATDRLIECPFAIILTISNAEVTRFLMLEDSYAVSKAATA